MGKEKHILISGTSSGLGLALATELSKKGFIIHAGIRKEADKNIFKKNKNIYPVILDVSLENTIDLALQKVRSVTGENGLYALINNAGINYIAAFEEADGKKERDLFKVNLFGAMDLTRKTLPLLHQHAKPGNTAKIINISSIGGILSLPWESSYHATKFAMLGWSQSIRYELEPLNISVCCFLPGGMKTKIFSKSVSAITAENTISAQRSYYEKNLDHMKTVMQMFSKSAATPEKASYAICKLLQRNKLPRKYFFGKDAKIIRLIGFLGLTEILKTRFVVKAD